MVVVVVVNDNYDGSGGGYLAWSIVSIEMNVVDDDDDEEQ